MIYFARPSPAGNAVQVLLAPPATALKWRLLRKASDTFAGASDPEAAVVIESRSEKAITDTEALVNGQLYYYRAFYWDGLVWNATATVSVTPGLGLIDVGVDPLLYVRQRLDDGLRGMVARGDLRHARNHIQVLAALPSIDDVVMPVVTVTMDGEAPAEYGIGDGISPGEFDDVAFEWTDFDGCLVRSTIGIAGWAMNVEERSMLRRAIRTLMLGNMSVFESAGMHNCDFSQRDEDDIATYNAPVFITRGTFTCLTAAAAAHVVDAIREVESNLKVGPTKVGPLVYPPV